MNSMSRLSRRVKTYGVKIQFCMSQEYCEDARQVHCLVIGSVPLKGAPHKFIRSMEIFIKGYSVYVIIV